MSDALHARQLGQGPAWVIMRGDKPILFAEDAAEARSVLQAEVDEHGGVLVETSDTSVRIEEAP